jgi:hypothetical protein
MDASLAHYRDALGFALINSWTPRGAIEWCMLERDGVRLMLQALGPSNRAEWQGQGPAGRGIRICIFCEDALAVWREALAAGIAVERPTVGNGLWVTEVRDPDGYAIDFESATDVPEETVYSGD